jgi:SAM-dependent methyltransferase
MSSEKSDGGQQWDAAVYDRKHSFVWKYGLEVVGLLEPKPGEKILDLGCGTGHLTKKIADSGAQVVGIDNSQAMIDSARKNYPGIRFELKDGTDFEFPNSFDAVFTNAAFHWMKKPARVAECVWRSLETGGRFVGEFGGKNNIRTLHGAICESLESAGYQVDPEAAYRYYPTIGEHATLLEQAGFCVTYAAYFDRPTPLDGGDMGLRSWLEMFATGLMSEAPAEARDDLYRDIESRLRPRLYSEETWYADYRRIRFAAVKVEKGLSGFEPSYVTCERS